MRSVAAVRRLRSLAGPANIVCVVLCIALPLEFLQVLPGVLMYAGAVQAFELFAELGLVFLAVGLLLAALCALAGALLGLLPSLKPTTTMRRAGDLASAVVVAVAALQALKTWMLQVGVQPMLRGWLQHKGLLPETITGNRPGMWLGISLLLALAWFWRSQHQKRDAEPAWPRLGAAAVLVLIAICGGLLMRLIWPIMDTRLPEVRPEAAASAGAMRPDVLLVTIDTFSAAHASLYGYRRDTTPMLSALASQASVFEHFYANGNFTTATVASLLTGQRPWTHRVFLAPGTPPEHDAQASLLAQFRRNGYFTMAVSTNPWAAPPRHGAMPHLDRHVASRPWALACPLDLDVFLDRWVSPQTTAIVQTISFWQAARQVTLEWALARGWCPPSGHFDPGLSLQQAQVLLAQAPAQQPRLLWVHLTPPHDPYAPPPPHVGRYDAGPQARRVTDSSPVYHYLGLEDANRQRARLEGRYDEAIRYVDDYVGRFLDELKRRGRFDGALIVVSADHGESFEHDYGGHGGPELYDEVIRIPLLIKAPGQQTGRRISTPAEQVDLLPTLLAMAGLPAPVRPVEGRSLLPLLQGQDSVRPVFSMSMEKQHPQAALRSGTVAMIEWPWKLTALLGDPDPRTPAPRRDRLYQLAEDPREQVDVAARHPEVVTRMRSAIEQRWAAHSLPPP